MLASVVRNENAALLQTVPPRRWMGYRNGEILAAIVGEATRTAIGASINLVWYIAASGRIEWRFIRSNSFTARCGIDRMRRSVQKAIKVIPSQRLHESVAERVVHYLAQMELAEVSAIVAASFQQFWRGVLIRRHLRIGKIIVKKRTKHVGTKRVSSFKEHRATRRALRHGPYIPEANAGMRDGVNIRCFRGIQHAAIAECGQLVDPDVIHDDEKYVRALPVAGGRRRHAGRGHRRCCLAPTQLTLKATARFL